MIIPKGDISRESFPKLPWVLKDRASEMGKADTKDSIQQFERELIA